MTATATPTMFRVAQTWRETADVAGFALEGPAGATAGAPGQFNMLTVFGVGEAAISLSEAPAAAGRFVHTVRAVGPVTRALAGLAVGDPVGLRGPFGKGWPISESVGRDVVIVGGGIGLAPLRPLLRHLVDQRARYGEVTVVYGARRPDDRVFLDDLAALRARADIDLRVTVDQAPNDWTGRVGFVTQHLEGAVRTPDCTDAFLCGPEVMMRFVADDLVGIGLNPRRIWTSLERNMNCGIGLCGHCQIGPLLVCRDGPVVPYAEARPLLLAREL